MFEIDALSKKDKAFLGKQGIPINQIELCARADRDREQAPASVLLLATGQTLYLADSEKGTLESYPLSALLWVRVEEQLSTGRLVAEDARGVFLLTAFTNFCKDSMLLFAKYIGVLMKDEPIQVDEKDLPEAKRCPKCGNRYPDPDRRVCPHCMKQGTSFKRFSVFLFRYRHDLVFTFLSLVVLTAMSILAPYISAGFFYDEVIDENGRFYRQILLVLGMLIATKLLQMGATMINNWVTSKVAAKMVFDLKKTIFTAIERLSLGFFTARQTGGLMTQVNEDSNRIYGFFCDTLPYFIINIVQIAVLTVLMFLLQPFLALISVGVIIPTFYLIRRGMFRSIKTLYARPYSDSRALGGFLADVLSGMRVVKAFAGEKDEIDRFSTRNRALAGSEKKAQVFNSYAWTLLGLIPLAGTMLVWGFGGWMVMTGNGGMTYGKLLTFIAYMGMIYAPLNFFSNMMTRAADCSNALQRLFEIMDAQPEVREAEHPVELGDHIEKIEFDDVCFSYQKGRRIIDHVSFSIEEGSVLGIVGHTGAGKSTIANLLMRLYDTESGDVRIGGHSVRELSFRSLYQNIAIVSQETYLFMGTILDNIRYAKPEADFAEVVEAAKCAGAHEFIMRMPDGYHTRIGAGFQELSGGERQRVSIARAILKNPKILILDEATAAMDTATERKIQHALSELVKGKTTIMIAHRLSTLRDADRLLVIERGKVAEEGTHAELLAKEDGIYKKLYTLQEEALKDAGILEED